jgi:hypothetical protein
MLALGQHGGRYWPTRLKGGSALAKGLVFAWAGNYGIELVNGWKPTNNNVWKSKFAGKTSWRFRGAAVGNSDFNFGPQTVTGNLGAAPCTFAFYCTVAQPNLLALAAQNDAVNSNGPTTGWQIYCSPSSNIAASFGRTVTNVQAIGNQSLNVHQPSTVVVTFDGGNLRSGINIYLNNQLGGYTGGTNGTGTSGDASAQTLYLGRRRFDTPLSHMGEIMVAMFANRQWSRAEVEQFSSNPYGMFQPARSMAYSFAVGSQAQAVFDSPDAAASILANTQIVFDVTAPTGFASATAAVTDSVVTGDPAWSLAGGFVAGYYGSTSVITNGYRVYLHRTGGWRTGALTVGLTSVGL